MRQRLQGPWAQGTGKCWRHLWCVGVFLQSLVVPCGRRCEGSQNRSKREVHPEAEETLQRAAEETLADLACRCDAELERVSGQRAVALEERASCEVRVVDASLAAASEACCLERERVSFKEAIAVLEMSSKEIARGHRESSCAADVKILGLEEHVHQLSLTSLRFEHKAALAEQSATEASEARDAALAGVGKLRVGRQELLDELVEVTARATCSEERAQWDRLRRTDAERNLDAAQERHAELVHELFGARSVAARVTDEAVHLHTGQWSLQLSSQGTAGHTRNRPAHEHMFVHSKQQACVRADGQTTRGEGPTTGRRGQRTRRGLLPTNKGGEEQPKRKGTVQPTRGRETTNQQEGGTTNQQEGQGRPPKPRRGQWERPPNQKSEGRTPHREGRGGPPQPKR